jgi:hypothetical protein
MDEEYSMIPLEMGIVVLSVILAPPPANSAPGLSFRLLGICRWQLLIITNPYDDTKSTNLELRFTLTATP